MIHILIAEDEMLERTALESILSERFHDMCEIHAVENGQQAIHFLRSDPPDIALLDIEMPGMNGMDLAECLKKANPKCRILFLTAYPEFEYAQRAVSLGATQYLLKPITDEEIIQTIAKTMEELQAETANETYWQERENRLRQREKEQFVLSVISKYESLQRLTRMLEELHMTTVHGFFLIVGGKDGDFLLQRLEEEFEDRLFVYEYDALFYCILFTEKKADSMEALSFLQKDAAGGEKEIFVSIGNRFASISEIHVSFDKAEQYYSYCTQANPVHFFDSGTTIREIAGQIYQYILDSNIVSISEYLKQLLETDGEEYLVRVLEKVWLIIDGDLQLSEDDAQQFIRLDALQTGSMLKSAVQLCNEWMLIISKIQAPTDFVQQTIEAFLNQHYSEPLSLHQVAHSLHYTDNYFSRLFKNCFHINFVSYLTNLRVQKAKQLLSDSTIRIKDISSSVGFIDAKYFSRVFRKETGVTPSIYRQLSTGRNDAV